MVGVYYYEGGRFIRKFLLVVFFILSFILEFWILELNLFIGNLLLLCFEEWVWSRFKLGLMEREIILSMEKGFSSFSLILCFCSYI